MPAPTLQFKRGLFANLPALRAGEPGFTTDSYELYIGINSTTQENKFFGSHRYWTRETTSTGSGINLVEGTSNGSHFLTLAAPGNLTGITTYYFPAANGPASSTLTNDGSGILSWSSGSANPVFTGISTFNTTLVDINSNVDISGITTFSNTTDNTLGDENTGAVQLDGGMGIAKNLTVKQNLHVGGFSEFVGVVTFRGGTINIGDNNTDNINIGGEFISNLTPNADNTFDIGISTQRWRDAYFSGVGQFETSVGVGTTNPITKLDVRGNTHISGDLNIDGGDVTSNTAALNIFNSTVTTANVLGAGTDILFGSTSGITTVRNNLTVGGDLRINGNDIQASDGVANITLTSNTLTAFAGDIRVNGNDIQASDGVANITLTSNTLTTFAGDIKVGGNDIQASDGTVAITLTGNDVTVADDLTVQGNLFVNGSTTQVSTAALTVEDRTIELGVVNGAAPASATTWDLGVLFNYNSTGAKKSAVVWETGDARFKFASVLGADTDGSDANTPQLTVTTFAPIEIGQLWVNDCAGSSQVISCTGTERFLENITIDAGSF